MKSALGLARRGIGNVWPNPAVGCVLVRPDLGQRVVGRGWTQTGGRPHGETEALGRAGNLAAGATAYVTLEPCDHTGQTGPCSQALIDAGISRAVVAIEDPDPRVSGRGVAHLRAAGIAVEVGLCGDLARQINVGFFSRVIAGRPYVTVKTATTLDGRIATRTGESQWITGPEARARGHWLRAHSDAILTGIGTVIADNPALTCRIEGLEDRSPVRVVVDSTARLPLDGSLARSAKTQPVWLYTCSDDAARLASLRELGVEVMQIEADSDGRPDLSVVLSGLADKGITRLLVEAGAVLSGSFFSADLVDEIRWFRSAKLTGGDGLAAIDSFGVEAVAHMRRFTRASVSAIGPDIMETYLRAND